MNKKILWSIGGVIVLAAGLWALLHFTGAGKPGSIVDNNKENPGSNTAPELIVKPGSPPTNSPTPPMSYTQALTQYGNNRIQFDQDCQAHPNKVVYKKGTFVMFDNRANHSRNISFGSQKLSILADNFAIVNMVAPSYPATILVDCDSKQNVATITIEK